MKKPLFIIIIIGLTAYLYASVTSLFYTANTLYEQEKYKEAIDKYEEILKEGYASGSLYYNLGNCYFKLGMLGKTILYYERAKRLMPRDPELIFNYNYVCSLLEDKIETPRKNWIIKKLDFIIYLLSLGRWIGLTAIIWLVFILSAITAVYFTSFRKVFKYIGIISVILLCIGLTNIAILYRETQSPQAIVLSKEIPVRYGPGEGEVEAFILHEGTKASIKKTNGEWTQIKLPDGKSGWLPQGAVEKI